MKHTIILLTTMLILFNACKNDPVATTTTLPDKASDFLFNGAVGTIYSFKRTTIIIDTNGVENKTGGEITTVKISQSVKTNTSGMKYIIYMLPGGETKSFIANDSTLWFGNADGTILRRIYLQKPFTENATFSRDAFGSNTKTMKIIDVNKQLTVPAGTYTVIGSLDITNDSLSTPKRVIAEKNWYSEGNGFVRSEVTSTYTFTSGKTSTFTNVAELISITLP